MYFSSIPEPVRDQKAALSPEDKLFLNNRLKRHVVAWTSFSVLGTVALLFWYEPTPEFAAYPFLTWATVTMVMVFSKRRIVAKNEKRITIGTITARFSRNENRSRNKSSEDEWVIEVNGKLMVVDKKTFGYYHKRDLAEFHYLDSGIILRHKLLKRGEKEYF